MQPKVRIESNKADARILMMGTCTEFMVRLRG